MPSLSIYATELYAQYGVKRICRVGTCGGISRAVAVSDVIVASSAHTNSAVATFGVPGVTLSLAASFDMLRGAVDQARGSGARVHVGPVFTSDFFYSSRTDVIPALGELGTLGVEMEAAGLYACALAEQTGEALHRPHRHRSPPRRLRRPLGRGARDPVPGRPRGGDRGAPCLILVTAPKPRVCLCVAGPYSSVGRASPW